MSMLEAALDRVKRFETELPTVDVGTRAALLGAWKEQVIGDCIAALRSESDPKLISQIDRVVAVVLEFQAVREPGEKYHPGE